jgi:hypothetical protein
MARIWRKMLESPRPLVRVRVHMLRVARLMSGGRYADTPITPSGLESMGICQVGGRESATAGLAEAFDRQQQPYSSNFRMLECMSTQLEKVIQRIEARRTVQRISPRISNSGYASLAPNISTTRQPSNLFHFVTFRLAPECHIAR